MNKEESVKKKPYANLLWMVWAILIIYLFVVVQTLVQSDNSFFSGDENARFVIFSTIGGILLFSVIYNLGKAVFAKFTGFKIKAINILVLHFTKLDGKWNFDFVFPEGIGGNVHVVPDKEYSKCKPILFHFGGGITSLIITFVACLISSFLDSSKKITFIFLILSLMGIVILIANLIPAYTDGINDGFAIRLLINKNNKKVYLDNLKQFAALNYGDGELMDVCYENYDDIFQGYSLIYRYYYFMNKEDFVNAEHVCDLMIEYNKFINSEDYDIAQTNKIYFVLLAKGNDSSYDYFYSLDKRFRNAAVSNANYEALKTGILIAGKVEKTYDLYEYLLKYEGKNAKKYYFTRIEAEKKLIQKSKEIVLKDFPDWEN